MARIFDLPFNNVTLTGVKTGYDKLGQPVHTVTVQLNAMGEQIGRLVDLASLGPLEVCFAPQAAHLTSIAQENPE